MATLDDIIIKPVNGHVFCEKQGSLFWPKTYKYDSSDGLRMRSKQECLWHSLLSKEGVYHTYEPNIRGTKYRPDFGIGNNFLLEVCGMVDSPQHNSQESVKKEGYRSEMDVKRKELLHLGYNVIEVYPKELVLNGYAVKNINVAHFVLGVVRKYSRNYLCTARDVSFKEI